jgi:ribonuclease Z
MLGQALTLGIDHLPFPVEIHEVKPGEVIGDRGKGTGERYDLRVFGTEHGAPSVGYALAEHERRGRFDPEKARAAGIPEGPLWGKLTKGETITTDDGRKFTPTDFVGPNRPGRLLVITGDTRPCASVVEAAQGADLLIHEATFGEEEKERAKDTKHSTALEAAQVALAAKAKRLVLVHLSARYSVAPEELLTEAKTVFPETAVARDGLAVDVPFAD